MEFVKKSSAVTEVLIPEGDVIRITDKATGNILWEKNMLCFEPIGDCSENFQHSPCAVFDYGTKLLLFMPLVVINSKSDVELDPELITYTPSNNNVSKLKTLLRSVDGIAMHPTNGKWIAFYSGGLKDSEGNYVNIETSAGEVRWLSKRDGTKFSRSLSQPYCCWVSHLNKFCVVNSGFLSILIDQDGYYTDYSENKNIKYIPGNYDFCETKKMDYSPTLKKIFLLAYSSTSGERLLTSTDGLNWDINGFPFQQHGSSGAHILWIDDLNILIAISDAKKIIYKSTDGVTWTEIATPTAFYTCAWSSDKKVFCGVFHSGKTPLGYITKDFVHWTKVRFHISTKALEAGGVAGGAPGSYLIWSNTANAFILTRLNSGVLFYKLEIE